MARLLDPCVCCRQVVALPLLNLWNQVTGQTSGVDCNSVAFVARSSTDRALHQISAKTAEQFHFLLKVMDISVNFISVEV